MHGQRLLKFIHENIREVGEEFEFHHLNDVEKDALIRYLVNDDKDLAYEVIPGAGENPELIQHFRNHQILYMDKLRDLVSKNSEHLNSEAIEFSSISKDQFKAFLFHDQWAFFGMLTGAIVRYIEDMVATEIALCIGDYIQQRKWAEAG